MKKTILKTILYTLIMTLLIAGALGEDQNETECGNQGFDCECQNFYNDSDYRAVAKWAYGESDYALEIKNPNYNYITTNVTGDLNQASYDSDNGNYAVEVYSVLVKAGNERTEYLGTSGDITSVQDISHITFCTIYYSGDGNGGSNGGGGCSNGNCNGVPEFSTVTLGAAIIIGALGLVYLRKR